MNFKEIRKKIEYYEKKHNEAFMICFDHDVNEVKAKMLDDAKDNKEYALAAIYDFCFIYRYANEKEEIKEYLDKHISQLENAKEISEFYSKEHVYKMWKEFYTEIAKKKKKEKSKKAGQKEKQAG